MPQETIHVVVPVVRTKQGKIATGSPCTYKTAGEALRRAERASKLGLGAIAFSRTGDSDYGEYDDPVLLGSFGEVPPTIAMKIVPIPF